MSTQYYNQLQIREIFHLEFLGRFSREIKHDCYALKGGVNLRFFFNSIRYSEDMDIDVFNTAKGTLIEKVMSILKNKSFIEILNTYRIQNVNPPNILKSKQTDTTQRFKIHLITQSGEDLLTKIEFSRRKSKGTYKVQQVSKSILRQYRMPPLFFSHFDLESAIIQKITALAKRSIIQVRDVFDIFILSTQIGGEEKFTKNLSREIIKAANNNIFEISYAEYVNSVVSYLSLEDQNKYRNKSYWEEIQINTSQFLEGMLNG